MALGSKGKDEERGWVDETDRLGREAQGQSLDEMGNEKVLLSFLEGVLNILTRTGRRGMLIVRRAVPNYSRGGMYLQAFFVVLALVWFGYRPRWAVQGPGIAMAFLAVAAILMAVRGSDLTRVESAVWIVVSVCLFAAEMHSIAAFQQTEEEGRQEQVRTFGRVIADGRQLFRAVNGEKVLTERNLELTAQNLEQVTGGSEYCWLRPMPPLPVDFGGDPAHQGGNYWQLELVNSGHVVLPSCDIELMPFPTTQEMEENTARIPQPLFYHFDRVRLGGHNTPYFITGDRIYSGRIDTPTRSFREVIKFDPAPSLPEYYAPDCTVVTMSGKVLRKEPFGQEKK